MTTQIKPRDLDRIIARERKAFWERKANDARDLDALCARASAGTVNAIQALYL